MVLYRYMLLVRWQIMETFNKILLRSVTRCCTCRRACLPPKSPVECEVALMAWLVRRLRALMVEEPLCTGDLTCRQPQRRSSFERERLSTGDISVQRAQRQQRRSFDLAQQQQRRSFEESLRVQQQRRSSQRSRRSSHGRVSRRTSERWRLAVAGWGSVRQSSCCEGSSRNSQVTSESEANRCSGSGVPALCGEAQAVPAEPVSEAPPAPPTESAAAARERMERMERIEQAQWARLEKERMEAIEQAQWAMAEEEDDEAPEVLESSSESCLGLFLAGAAGAGAEGQSPA